MKKKFAFFHGIMVHHNHLPLSNTVISWKDFYNTSLEAFATSCKCLNRAKWIFFQSKLPELAAWLLLPGSA